MTGLNKFVKSYKDFMVWLDKKQHRDPGEYVKRFEKIFSVTSETELVREIQDLKDELKMLAAVFKDQVRVLGGVVEHVSKSQRTSLKTRPSAFNFTQQSEKHASHIKRMQDQTKQAYENVSIYFEHRSMLIHPTIS
jgi:hypothetical protein